MKIIEFIKRYTERRPMVLLPAIAALLALAAGCASMGRPEGGPRDVDPPVFIGADPADGALNVKQNKFTLRFDENVDLKNVQQTVIVSPAQKRMPLISANGHNVRVELRDTMRDSTTYTIDFGDAIADLNEGNQLDGFAYAFSTGPVIDTLSFSGMVFEARTLEPAQGMLVGAYRSDAPDSAIATLPLERVTRTNQLGQFTLRNLAPGAYRVYALKDNNSDYIWDRSEDVAFLDSLVVPTTESVMVQDTIKASDGTDSIVSVATTRFLPNDVLLTWFNEGYKASYLTKYERTDTNRISLLFNAPQDSMPQLGIVADGGPLARLAGRPMHEWLAIDATPGRDTLDIWITDTAVVHTDSLFISARYQMTDTADQLVWQTDTLKVFHRRPKASKKKDKEDDRPKLGNRDRNRQRKGSEGNDSLAAGADSLAADTVPVPEIPKIHLTLASGSTQQLNQPVRFTVDKPMAIFDSTTVRLMEQPEGDSVWTQVKGFRLMRAPSGRLLELVGSPVEWKSGASYKVTVDSSATVSVYGEPLENFSADFKARNRDEYSSIIFNISGTGGRAAVVELLDKSDKPLRQANVGPDGRAVFDYLDPSDYYARLYFDANGNGVYDTGSLLDSIQPEETVYFPSKIPLKKNWDLEQTWNVYEMPLDMQKHKDIKKNKPKPKPGEVAEDEDEEEEQGYDQFGRPITGSGSGAGGNNSYTNPFGGSGGFRRQQSSGGRL